MTTAALEAPYSLWPMSDYFHVASIRDCHLDSGQYTEQQRAVTVVREDACRVLTINFPATGRATFDGT